MRRAGVSHEASPACSGHVSRPSTLHVVCSCTRYLGSRAIPPALGAQRRGHPVRQTKDAAKQVRHGQVGIELGVVNKRSGAGLRPLRVAGLSRNTHPSCSSASSRPAPGRAAPGRADGLPRALPTRERRVSHRESYRKNRQAWDQSRDHYAKYCMSTALAKIVHRSADRLSGHARAEPPATRHSDGTAPGSCYQGKPLTGTGCQRLRHRSPSRPRPSWPARRPGQRRADASCMRSRPTRDATCQRRTLRKNSPREGG